MDQSEKTDQQVLGHNIALLRQLLLRRNSHKRTEEVEQQATDDDVTRLIYSYKRTIAKRNSLPTCDSCCYPEIDSINATSTNKAVNASNKRRQSTCAPYEIPVRIPNNIIIYPDPPFVPLHRCLGSDDTIRSAFSYRCKATSKETVRVQYKGLRDGQIYEVAMHNHTSCKMACHMTTSCGPNKIFDKDNCYCYCPLTQNDCSKGTILNSDDCECRCAQMTSCHTIYEKYNWRTCKCECDQRLKDICRENNLSINPQRCACM